MNFPLIGFGTYKIRSQDDINNALNYAFKHNYKMIDTAEIYKNQKQIGNYLFANKINRNEIWITSKVSFVSMKKSEEEIIKGINKTFEDLQTDYIDLYLIHSPVEERYIFAWKYIRELQEKGKIRYVGVSNFTVPKLRKFMDLIGPEESKYIFCNQIEYNPFLNRTDIIDFCHNNNINITAYGSLYKYNQIIEEIANKLNKTPQQVLLRWSTQKNIHVIPTSLNEDYIKQNMDIQFDIPDNDVNIMNQFNENFSNYPKYL